VRVIALSGARRQGIIVRSSVAAEPGPAHDRRDGGYMSGSVAMGAAGEAGAMGVGPERLRARWRAGAATLGGWIMTHDGILAEQLARCGFDEVSVDLQHGSVEIGHLTNLFMAIAAGGAVPMVRIPAVDPVTIGRVLDVGAAGVIVAMIETGAQAAEVVRACRYTPHGTRSAGPLRAQFTLGSGDWDDLTTVIKGVMVESAEGLANVEEIAGTPGIDGIYIGPGDLGIALGMPPGRPRTDEQKATFAAAIDRILRACQDAGVVAGIHTGDGATAGAWVRRGFQWVTVVSEYGLVINGGNRELAAARETIAAP
jgi:4-hydroxy-2-oxoheptanedioate aldolase